MQSLEPAVRAITIQLLDPLIEAGGASLFRIHAQAPRPRICSVLSPVARACNVHQRNHGDLQPGPAGGERHLVKETSLRLYELARLIIEMRKVEPWDPAEDPTSALLHARGNDGEFLPENLVLGTIRQMIVVGMIVAQRDDRVYSGALGTASADRAAVARRARVDSGCSGRISASLYALSGVRAHGEARRGIRWASHSQGRTDRAGLRIRQSG